MIAATALGQAPHWSAWITSVMLVAAGAGLAGRRLIPRALAGAVLIISISLMVAVQVVSLWPTGAGPVQNMVRICGVLSVVWIVMPTIFGRGLKDTVSAEGSFDGFPELARMTALFLAVAAGSVQGIVLTMRAVHVAVDSVAGDVSVDLPPYGFGESGVWGLGCLFVASVLALLSIRDRRLVVWVFATGVLLLSWVCLLGDALRQTPSGGFERTGLLLVLLSALSAFLALMVVLTGWWERRRHARCVQRNPDGLPPGHRRWPGLAAAAMSLAPPITLLVCFHLAVPIAWGPTGFRGSLLVTTAAAGIAGASCFLLVTREWHPHLGEAAMGLMSLAVCGLFTCLAPQRPVLLAERYPIVFNAMIVGLAVAAAWWAWLSVLWEQQLDDAGASTTTGRLIPFARRFSFLNAAFALVISIAMCVWPRWPGIATMDHTLGRVLCGFAANLFLLLVCLWCGRRLRRVTFHWLTLMVTVSMVGFLVARMLPFTSRYG